MSDRDRNIELHVRSIDKAARSATFIASTAAIDSYGEVVDQASWRLDRYRANPVVLFGHQSRELPVGTATSIGLEGGKLVATVQFTEAHQRARDVWALVAERTLRAVSVGFMPATERSEKRDGRDVVVLADCELIELSIVPIPANPETLMRARADRPGMEEVGDDLEDLVRADLEGVPVQLAGFDDEERVTRERSGVQPALTRDGDDFEAAVQADLQTGAGR